MNVVTRLGLFGLVLMLFTGTPVEANNANMPLAVGGGILAAAIIGGGGYYLYKKKVAEAQHAHAEGVVAQFESKNPETVELANLDSKAREQRIFERLATMTDDEVIVHYQGMLFQRSSLRSLGKNAEPECQEKTALYLACVEDVLLQTYRKYYAAWYEKIAQDSYFKTDKHITWKMAARFPQSNQMETKTYALLIEYQDALQTIINILLGKPVHPQRDKTLTDAELLLARIKKDIGLLAERNPQIKADFDRRLVAGAGAAQGSMPGAAVVAARPPLTRAKKAMVIGGLVVAAGGVVMVMSALMNQNRRRARFP